MRPMTPEEIEDAANRDADNRPLSAADLVRMKRTPQVKVIRRALGLSQEEFSEDYDIPIGTLRDWEQGRAKPDQSARAYLTIIARDPEAVRRALHIPRSRPTPRGDVSVGTAGDPAQNETSSATLFGDRPIKSELEDILGLSPFADALAKSLTEMVPDDGLVVSVEGKWGTGKTSALELTQRRVIVRELARELRTSIAEIEERDWFAIEAEWNDRAVSRRTHLIRFNPWNFSGQENLVKAFFSEVGAIVGYPPHSPIARAIKNITGYLPSAGIIVGSGIGTLAGGLPAAGVGATAGRAAGEGIQRAIRVSESLETAKQQLGTALREVRQTRHCDN